MTGRELIAAERRRQVEVEKYDGRHDDAHRRDEMARAAHCYVQAANFEMHTGRVKTGVPRDWPWAKAYWKPKGGPVRVLVMAGALYCANAERLLRIHSRKSREMAERNAALARQCADLIDALQAGTWQKPPMHRRRVVVTMEVYGPEPAADQLMDDIGMGIELEWLEHMRRQMEGAETVGHVNFEVKGQRWEEGDSTRGRGDAETDHPRLERGK